MTSSCYEAARHYLSLGLHPIPCAASSKRPIVEWREYQERLPLADEIDEWWETTPDANVALVLGRGTFAADLDGGAEAEKLLIDHGVLLPGAPRSRTANGYHVFLSAPGPVPDRVALLKGHTKGPNGKAPQVDIRGVGIVVAPPSIHPSGAKYEWHIPLALPFPPAPQTLLDLISASRPDGHERHAHEGLGASWVIEALRGVGEGGRDATCTRLVGYFLGQGLDAATVEALLVESFARNCTPRFSPDEVRKCVRSIARKERVAGDRDRHLVPEHHSTVLARIRTALNGAPPRMVPTPFPSLNEYLAGGFAPGELVYLGAGAGVGKSAMAVEMARRAARDGHGVLIVSREMVNDALGRRELAQAARVSAKALRRNQVRAGDLAAIDATISQIGPLPIWMTDEAASLAEISEMVASAPSWSGTSELGLLIVDYVQLVRAPRDIRERRLQVEAVSQGLKNLAVQSRIAVLGLSSLTRAEKGKNGKPARPTLASLRESAELEHDADIVLLLHREPRENRTECIVAKARDGEQGLVELIFRGEFVAFDEAARRGDGV